MSTEHTSSLRASLATLSLAMMLSSLGTSIANVALPTLASHFDVPFQAVQWVVLAYLLAVTISIVGAGKLGDLFGRRRLLRLGLVLFAAASLVAGAAPALSVLVAARAVQGLGAAIMMALSVALVGEILPKNETGRAMGLLGTTSAIGTALGPSLGGVLIDQLGWQAIFLLNLPLGALGFALATRYLPADRRTAPSGLGGFDVAGTLLLALSLAAYALAMTIGRGAPGAQVALLAGAALAAGLFVRVETRAASPLIRLSTFRDPALSASLAASLLVATVLMATLVVGPFHLSLSLGLEPGVVGLVMSIGPLVAAFTGVPAGWLVDRLGSQRTTVAGLSAIAVGALALAALPETLGIAGYVAPITVVTAGYAAFQTANNTAVMAGVGPEQRGVVSGLLSLSRNLGLVTGASLMGAVFALASGTDDITAAAPEAVAAGMRATFAVGAVLVVVALAFVAGGRALASRRLAGLVAGALVLASFSGAAAAQEIPSDRRGFVLRSTDGESSLRVMGLLQLQYAHEWPSASPETDSFTVHRARVGLLGSVFTRDLRYLLVTELGGGDVRLLFAHLDYTLVPDWLTVRVGQFKRPFSRSFITFASQLSMIERPLTVGPRVFGDAVDTGVMLHDGTAGSFEYAVGVFAGGALTDLPDRMHPLLAVRVGYETEGLGGYSESDLEGGAPRFGIAVAGMADFDGHGEHDSFVSGTVDLMFEAYGLSITSALYVGARQGGASWSEQRYSAIGHYTQIGYVIAGVVEPVVRYAFMMPAGQPAQHDFAGGLNLYFEGHALKLQSFVSARLEDERATPDVRFQSQLSVSL